MTNPTISQINAAILTLSHAGLIKPAQAVSLARKAEKLKLKAAKLARQNEVNARVSEALADILKEDGSATQHRAVWVAVGREDHTRDEVLADNWSRLLIARQLSRHRSNKVAPLLLIAVSLLIMARSQEHGHTLLE